jgi:hypothetical protein
MDELWRRDGLDLKMLSYTCLATGKQVGLIQVVSLVTCFSISYSWYERRWIKKGYFQPNVYTVNWIYAYIFILC